MTIHEMDNAQDKKPLKKVRSDCKVNSKILKQMSKCIHKTARQTTSIHWRQLLCMRAKNVSLAKSFDIGSDFENLEFASHQNRFKGIKFPGFFCFAGTYGMYAL